MMIFEMLDFLAASQRLRIFQGWRANYCCIDTFCECEHCGLTGKRGSLSSNSFCRFKVLKFNFHLLCWVEDDEDICAGFGSFIYAFDLNLIASIALVYCIDITVH